MDNIEQDAEQVGAKQAPFFSDVLMRYQAILSGIERERFNNLTENIGQYAAYYAGREVLDFGASRGLSAVVALIAGASQVIGVEPELARVDQGRAELDQFSLSDRIQLTHLSDTTRLPFPDESFDFVMANAVFEHIPQPRNDHLKEIFRVLRPGGYFLLTETPNKYFPKEKHTTGLWFNHWLPRRLAYARARRAKRYNQCYESWIGSGWRGLGYFEMKSALGGKYSLVPEKSHWRHRVLSMVGLPASLFDPYPAWLLRKD